MRLFRRGEGASTLDLLVAGLGNPGREYAATRHNVGWLVVDELATRHGGSWRSKFSGQLAEVRLGDLRLGLLKPETYMNESGRSIGAAVRFFKVEPEALLVVHDDVDLDEGRLAGAAGRWPRGPQRAAVDRADALVAGLPASPRRRRPPGRGDRRSVADYVLSGFDPAVDVDALLSRSADAVETIARDGLEVAQQRFN